MSDPVTFHTTVRQTGKTTCGVLVPPSVVAQLAAGKRPPVVVTINGASYRSTLAVYGEEFWVGVSAENRAITGVAGGDEVDVTLALDTQPREIELPDDFAAALLAEPEAKA